MSFRRRITLVSAAAVAITVIVGSVLTYVLVRNQMRGQIDSSLRGFGVAIQTSARDIPRGVSASDLEPRRRPNAGRRLSFRSSGLFRPPLGLPGANQPVIQVISPNGTAVFIGRSVGNTPLRPDARAIALAQHGGAGFFSETRVNGDHLRSFTVAIANGHAVRIFRSLNEVDSLLSRLRWILLAVIAGGVALAALLGRLVAGTALAPVRRLTETAEHVAATRDLAHRIQTETAGDDELGRLAVSFNSMLDALERSISALDESARAQRQLVADASHELRTPVTSLRTNIEILQAAELPAAERSRMLGDVVEQLEELTALINDVIELARGDEPATETEDVRFDDVVAGAIERARLHAPAAQIAADLEPTLVEGVPSRLDRAVRNLIDNAIKFGDPGAPIEIALRGGELTVRDHGRGIETGDLPHVFDRFYRGRHARALPGSGLGLAIVRQVAEAHGGTVSAQLAAGGGTLMRLRLPAQDVGAAEPVPAGASSAVD